MSEKNRARIVANIKKLVLKHHFNLATVDLAAWSARLAERTAGLTSATPEEFEAEIRRSLAELGTSHTAFYHELPKRFPPQHTINATLSLVPGDQPYWMFVDVFEGGPAHSAGIGPGDVLIAMDGEDFEGSEPPQFGFGAAHRLTIRKAGGGGTTDVRVEVPFRKATVLRPPMVEPRPITFRMVERRTGLLRVVYFPGAFGMRFGRELDAAISSLKDAGCERLILDLRGNIGGSLGFARLASYLTPDIVAIGHSLTPERHRTGFSPSDLPEVVMPRTRSELLSTLARFAFADKSVMLMTQGLGKQPFHERTVVLMNEWTNSAGEMVAAFANALSCTIGMRTRGNVLGARNFGLGHGYWIRLPVFGWYSSEGLSLDGTGVEPNKEVSTAELADGIDVQLDEAVCLVRGM